MPGLAVQVDIVFPRLTLTPETRPLYRAVRQAAIVELRQMMNGARRDLRNAAPKQSRALSQSIRVRRVRAPVPGAISYEVSTSKFYASFTDTSGRSAGWWTSMERRIEAEGRKVALRAGRALAPVFAAHYRAVFERDLRRTQRQFRALVIRLL